MLLKQARGQRFRSSTRQPLGNYFVVDTAMNLHLAVEISQQLQAVELARYYQQTGITKNNWLVTQLNSSAKVSALKVGSIPRA